MKITNKHGLPEAIVEAVKNDPYSKGDSDYSVTEILNPPQLSALEQKHSDEIEVDAMDSIWSLQGKAIHEILDRAEPSAMTEERLFMDIGLPNVGKKVTLSGQYDRLYLQDGVLQDYKVTSIWTRVYGSRLIEWRKQLNLLNLLANHKGYSIKKLQIICFYRDWTQYQSEKVQGCPKQQVETIDMKMDELEDVYNFAIERIELHERARNGEQIDCTDEERWQSSTVYKIMKEGRKNSLKNYADDLVGAEAFQRHYQQEHPNTVTNIVEFPGKYNRCEGYCNASKFCPQFKG